MFIFFHQNKFSNKEKGQIIPIFIAVIVVLLIMAMVTVNLSKVAFVKTDSSNAVDAGALAAGSVMANVFNAIAQANSQMEAFYWEFFASVSITFVLALSSLRRAYGQSTSALAQANAALDATTGDCGGVCGAIANAESAAAFITQQAVDSTSTFISAMLAIIVAVTAFHLAQHYFYLSIRDRAEEGRLGALRIGQQFAFMNSGIGSKLKEGWPPADIDDADQERNYRNTFSNWLDDDIGEVEELTYPWKDGQQRNHYVRARVSIDLVDTYDLKVAILPFYAEIALLLVIRNFGYRVNALLTPAGISYAMAAKLFSASCRCMGCCSSHTPACCSCWHAMCNAGRNAINAGIRENTAARNLMTQTFPLLALRSAGAWGGLLPGPVIRDSSGDPMFMFIICWIDDVVHNRRVRLDTWQYHQGGDLGLWGTGYPDADKDGSRGRDIHSYSVVDFTGMGEIHPPVLRHDSSIIATDVIGEAEPSTDPNQVCNFIRERIATLETQIDELNATADDYDAKAAELEHQAQALRALGFEEDSEEVLAFLEPIRLIRGDADDLRSQAETNAVQIETLEADYPYCIAG